MLGELVVFIVFGIVIGAVGRFMVVGGFGDRAAPWIGHGILGALFGGAVGHLAGARAPDAVTGTLLASYVAAIVFVTVHWGRASSRATRIH